MAKPRQLQVFIWLLMFLMYSTAKIIMVNYYPETAHFLYLAKRFCHNDEPMDCGVYSLPIKEMNGWLGSGLNINQATV
jgi:hypothetical protein